MGFLTAVAKFLSKEVLRHMGEDALAEGRRVFAEQLGRGLPQQEAARLAAKHMMAYALDQGRGKILRASREAALRTARDYGRRAAGRVAGGLGQGARLLRDRLRRKG